jgi:hypothetical protein
MLEPSIAAASGPTSHRRRSTNPHSADGHRELPLGRAAHPRRVAEPRSRRLRTHGIAYLPDRGTVRSQTWRTFLATQLVALASTSTVTSNLPVDASDARFCLAPSIRANHRCVVVEWRPSFQRPSPGARVAPDLLDRRRAPANKDPPYGVDRRIGAKAMGGMSLFETTTSSGHQSRER